MKKNILIFGGAGFIGSNYIRKVINKNFFVVNIDALTYASSNKNINDLNKFRNYKFIRSNIIDSVSIRKILRLYKVSIACRGDRLSGSSFSNCLITG